MFIDHFQYFHIGDKISIKKNFFMGRRKVSDSIANYVIRNNNRFTIDSLFAFESTVMIGLKEINEAVEYDQVSK